MPPSYFGERFGHALVVIKSAPNENAENEQGRYMYVEETVGDSTISRRSVDQLFLLGGDDFNVVRLPKFSVILRHNLRSTFVSIPPYLVLLVVCGTMIFKYCPTNSSQIGGGGGYKNDIWATSGAGKCTCSIRAIYVTSLH